MRRTLMITRILTAGVCCLVLLSAGCWHNNHCCPSTSRSGACCPPGAAPGAIPAPPPGVAGYGPAYYRH
jgi:hypothetical protein